MASVKLGTLVNIKTGKLDANAADECGLYPFFTCSIQPLKINAYEYDCECVLVAGNGDLNVKYYSGKFNAYQRTYIIEAEDRNILSVRFLYYFLNKYITKLRANAIGGVIKYIKLGDLTGIDFPILSLSEQEKIVARLDKANEIRDKKIKANEKLDELIKSQFDYTFGDPIKNEKNWKVVLLNDISSVGSSKRVFVDELLPEGIPFYRGTEIGLLAENKKIKPELFISNQHYLELCSHTGSPKVGDLLLPSICFDGRIWEVNNSNPFYFKDGRVLWIKNVKKEKVNSTYLRYFLNFVFKINYAKFASGSNFAELKIFELKKVKIILPNVELQNQFAKFVGKIEAQKSKNEIVIQKMTDLINSIMQKEFTN